MRSSRCRRPDRPGARARPRSKTTGFRSTKQTPRGGQLDPDGAPVGLRRVAATLKHPDGAFVAGDGNGQIEVPVSPRHTTDKRVDTWPGR